MNTYLALFLIATFSSLVLTPLIRRLGDRFKLLDVPTLGRKNHRKAVPRLGGVAIYLSCLIAMSALPLVDNLLTQSLRQRTHQIFIALVPATLVLLLGIYDDLRGAKPWVKFVGLTLIATLFYVLGGRIEALSVPGFGSVDLPATVSYVLTVFWLVGITNAFNLIDGVDGLASGAALFSSMTILAVSFGQGAVLMIVVTLVLCGALAGFLRYNFNPASIFLGDSGALFVGFTLASLSVVGAQKATTAVAIITPVLAFGLPVVDTAVTMARRLISGKPLFEGDNEHIHHMLLARGWSQRQVALVLYGVCASFAVVAMLFAHTGPAATGFVLFVVAVVVLIAVGHLRYHEMDELRAGVKRTVGDRRTKLANNIRVRRASRALTTASDLRELFDAVSIMLDSGEFEHARMQLGHPAKKVGDLAIQTNDRLEARRDIELKEGRVYWKWHRTDAAADDEFETTTLWCLRVPLTTPNGQWGWINLYRAFNGDPLLVDMNYLSGLFRNELSFAAERILESFAEDTKTTELRMTAGAGKSAGC